jgi:hypothetical protein
MGRRGAVVVLLLVASGCQGEAVTPAHSDAGLSAEAAPSSPLLTNSNFESGCAGWSSWEGTLEDVTTARSGSHACRVCSDGTTRLYGIGQGVPRTALTVGKKYVGEVWVRADDRDSGPVPTPYAKLEIYDAAENQLDAAEGGKIALDGTWKRASAVITVTPATDSVYLSFAAYGGCFLLDDASLQEIR